MHLQLFVAAGIRFYSSGWISSKTSIGQVLVEFYKALFTTSALAIPKDMENLIEPNSTLQDNEMLTSTPNAHEIFATLQKIHPEQAPNPDGMTVTFFNYVFFESGSDGCCSYNTGFL